MTEPTIVVVQEEESAILVLARDPAIYIQGSPGPPGRSAYQVALDNGFVGTEQDWLDSLESTQWILIHW